MFGEWVCATEVVQAKADPMQDCCCTRDPGYEWWMAWTDPRSYAMPLAMPLTANPLAGSKIYYAAGQMPLTSQLDDVLVETKCH